MPAYVLTNGSARWIKASYRFTLDKVADMEYLLGIGKDPREIFLPGWMGLQKLRRRHHLLLASGA